MYYIPHSDVVAGGVSVLCLNMAGNNALSSVYVHGEEVASPCYVSGATDFRCYARNYKNKYIYLSRKDAASLARIASKRGWLIDRGA